MRPPEVLDHQAALIDYLGSAYYQDYLGRVAADMTRKRALGPTSGPDLARQIRTSLIAAQAFHVQREMMTLLKVAAQDLDDDDYLTHTHVPAEHGFLVFDEPWRTTDVWGEPMGIAAINWRHGSALLLDEHDREVGTKPGLWVTYFTDINDEGDKVNQDLIAQHGIDRLRQAGRFHVNHIWFLHYDEPVGPAAVIPDAEYNRWAVGDAHVTTDAVLNDRRLLVGLFRLLNQVIVEVADAPVDRATVRRMTRKNLPARVQTIKLRRKEILRDTGPVGDGHVDWRHQWPVRGHWAWRHCSAEHPLAEEYEKGYHARVYVEPYWKGPEGAPIKLSEKVWGLAQ